MNLKEIKQLIDQVNESGLTEFSYSKDGERIVLKKEKELVSGGFAAPVYSQAPVAAPVTSAVISSSTAQEIDTNLTEIKAPMVGTFYSAPSPDSADFVKVGDKVKVGQVICIIEAMKLMNEIEADSAGTISEICIPSGNPVEYGSTLFKITPN